MSTFKRLSTFIIIATAICLSMAITSVAQDKTTHDLNDLFCKDIMRLSGSDRDIAMAALHGFMLGKKGTTTYNPEQLAEATDQFIEYCLDNPTAKVLDAFSKFTK